jgi:hypothetical protein
VYFRSEFPLFDRIFHKMEDYLSLGLVQAANKNWVRVKFINQFHLRFWF